MLVYYFGTVKDATITQAGKQVTMELRDGHGTDTFIMDRETAELLKWALVNQLK